jgi:hypothetical protein
VKKSALVTGVNVEVLRAQGAFAVSCRGGAPIDVEQ